MITKVPYYHSVGKEIEVFEQSYKNKIPLLLKGPTGTGKSRFVEYMAHKLNKELITISCHEETSSTDLIGRFIIKGAETVWLDGPLIKAIKEGAIIYLDEIAEARPDVVVAIHSLTDHRRELYIDKLGETIKAHEDFMLVASFNPGYQKGFKELFGTTIFDFYQTQRMEHAKYLLYDKGLSVTEVSSLLGYSSISHFSTAFKKHTGIKPCELLLH